MGLIADIASGRTKAATLPGLDSGRRRWEEIFGRVSPRVLDRPDPHVVRPVPGGSWGRQMLAEPAAFKRLLQAMRSMAPGGWSDNRWEQSKAFVGIAYIAIHRMATQWQQAEFQVFEEDDQHPDGKRPVGRGHPGYRLVELLKNPNRQDSFGKHLYRTAQQKYLTGTSLTWMVPNVEGVPMEIYNIPTGIAIPQPAINPDYPDGYYRIQPVYPYGPFSSYPTPATSVGAPVPAQWVIRHQFAHPILRYDGYSPCTGLSMELDEFRSISKSRFYKMMRALNPEAVLNFEEMSGAMPLPWEEIERIHQEMQNENAGPENSGRLLVSTPGAKLEQWGSAPKEMDYPASFDQLLSFNLAGFGPSKPAAGISDDASYANLWASLKQLHLLVLKADLDDVASDYTKHLAPHFAPNLIVEIRCPRIDDHEQLLANVDKLIQGKAIKKGELRQMLDRPLLNEPWEDEFAGDNEQGEAVGMPSVPEMVKQATTPQEQVKEKEEEKLPTKKPDTGDLGKGSLPDRGGLPKRLNPTRIQTKSLYEQLRKACRNGNGKSLP